MNKQIDSKKNISIKPYAPNIGAIITGIDLSKKISNSELKIIKDAFHDH